MLRNKLRCGWLGRAERIRRGEIDATQIVQRPAEATAERSRVESELAGEGEKLKRAGIDEAVEAATLARLGRLAMLGGALAACAPALGQFWRFELLGAAQTLGHAAVMAGLAASVGGKR